MSNYKYISKIISVYLLDIILGSYAISPEYLVPTLGTIFLLGLLSHYIMWLAPGLSIRDAAVAYFHKPYQGVVEQVHHVLWLPPIYGVKAPDGTLHFTIYASKI